MITVLSLLIALIVSGFCPNEIPIHFMGQGADQLINKWLGLFLFPVMMAILLLLQRSYASSARFIYFFAALHIVLLYNAITY
ncbi:MULTISPECIES: DUF1648 domain-containing protein [Paenibacillus]|uniref:DUF1648 domain-containing protein n=2 Tax=Paenibacillus vulneris TaxID=1133364 RepID=A0ABW3UG93_9BACL